MNSLGQKLKYVNTFDILGYDPLVRTFCSGEHY